MTGIVVRDLCVQFDDHAPVLDGLSLEVAAGEIVALLGGSGSGKSTLLRAIARLQNVQRGEVSLSGESPKRRAGDMAYVFQDATLLPWRTAEQNVQLPLELAGGTGDGRRSGDTQALIADALEAVGLARQSWNKYPRQLSGGMRMRVSLARAIVTDPAILLLDEPFGALDEILRNRMNDLLIDLWLRKPRTILFVTHNIAEAVNLSRRLAILGGGKISAWIDNPLPVPRNAQVRSSPEFAAMYSQVATALGAA